MHGIMYFDYVLSRDNRLIFIFDYVKTPLKSEKLILLLIFRDKKIGRPPLKRMTPPSKIRPLVELGKA